MAAGPAPVVAARPAAATSVPSLLPKIGASLQGTSPLILKSAPSVDFFSRRFVAMMHSSLCLMLFAPMAMLSFSLYLNTDADFFLGMGISIANLVVNIIMILCLVVIFLIHLYIGVGRLPNWFFIATFWVPSILYISIAGVYRQRTMDLVGVLKNPDCTTFAEKRDLQAVYVASTEFYELCARNVPFVPMSISECPNFPPSELEEHEREWKYLRSLENRLGCSGICEGGLRVWKDVGRQAPSCDTFVAEWVMGAHSQATTMFWYAIFILILSMPLYVLVVDLIAAYTGRTSSLQV